jgi:hypothetical protein
MRPKQVLYWPNFVTRRRRIRNKWPDYSRSSTVDSDLLCELFCVKVKGKVVPVLKHVPLNEGVLGEWRYSSTNS